MRKLIIIIFVLLPLHGFATNLSEYLLPAPKKITLHTEYLSVNHLNLSIQSLAPQHNKALLQIIHAFNQTQISTHLSPLGLIAEPGHLHAYIDHSYNEQAYHLSIFKDGITLRGGSEVGLYYGLLTLQQIGAFAMENKYWPCLEIMDEPDFESRGVMLDISRDKVPTLQTLYALIDQLALWKTNEIQLYTEHTFAYKNHKTVWQNASPMTAEDIRKLDAYCQLHFIDLVPNQNSFGHMKRWLKHKEYEHLAELLTPGKTIWGYMSRTSLSPVESGSLELMRELYAELLPNFSSRYFNIGCDETVELGIGKSKIRCNQQGKGRVYLDFLLKLKREVDKHKRITQFWGDIILHHPELIPELPKDMVALIWGYEANHPFSIDCPKFKKAGLAYYVCPGTSTWNSLIGQNTKAFANLKNAAINGKKHGAMGYLNTNWGDQGHWQPLTVCYPSLLYGAALSWHVENNKAIDIAQHVSRQVYKDKTGTTGQVIVNLGNAYLKMGALTDNSTIFHQLLKRNKYSIKTDRWLKHVNLSDTEKTIAFIQAEMETLNRQELHCADAEIIRQELKQATDLAIHSCKLAKAKLLTSDGLFSSISTTQKQELKKDLQELIDNHRKIWVLRNRPGGLNDSARKMTNVLKSYN